MWWSWRSIPGKTSQFDVTFFAVNNFLEFCLLIDATEFFYFIFQCYSNMAIFEMYLRWRKWRSNV